MLLNVFLTNCIDDPVYAIWSGWRCRGPTSRTWRGTCPAYLNDRVPVTRFYRGVDVHRKMEGTRVFGQVHRGRRRLLIDYLDALVPRRTHVSTRSLASGSGLLLCRQRCTTRVDTATNFALRASWRCERWTFAWRLRPGAWSTANVSSPRFPSVTERLSIPDLPLARRTAWTMARICGHLLRLASAWNSS